MELEALMREQDGVIARRQVLACGLDDDFIECRLRRRDWARVHRGVYVDHTGKLSWKQRVWAAILFAWPAVAADETALGLHELRPPGADDTVVVGISPTRRVDAPDGVTVRHVSGLEHHVQPNRNPPRMRLEPAVLRVASRAMDDARAVAVLADACQSRRTTAARLAACLEPLGRLPRRRLLRAVLRDVAEGAFSLLEHLYLTRVERPHGLPTGRRQRRVRLGRTTAYRDVEYLGGALIVELDGRLGHEGVDAEWADLERDVDSTLDGAVTTRLGWIHVLDPCRVARAVGRLLKHCGWTGSVRACGPRCTAVLPAPS